MDRSTSRRNVLKIGGAAVGGLTVGSLSVGGSSVGRYLMKPKAGANLSRVTVEEELPEIEYIAVSGQEEDVKSTAIEYAPDPILDLDEPTVNSQVPADALDSVDEPLYELQWDKQDLSVPEAQTVTEGTGIRVAVIDSGIAADHPDLDNVNLELSENFSGDGLGVGYPYGGYHGTHVSGIIAANNNNETGVLGTAPGAELVDCRVFPYDEGAPFSVVLAAVLHSVEIDADIANMSLGGYAPRREYVDDGRYGKFYGEALNQSLTYANREGTLVVMSAGNSGADLQHDKQWISLPNEGAQGLSISATGPIGFEWGDPGLEEDFASPAFYTNYGTNAIDLGAPGGDADLETENPLWYLDLVLSTVAEFKRNEDGDITGGPSYSYGWAAGTSMAAPNVSGAAALVKANNPDYSPTQLKSALKQAASVPSGYDKRYYGSGYLNILDAL
ncbi:peptidase S8 and S53 subtilisin kexin sedolisin [Haladaptatus sp. W1]|nr:peptidase S8 and S53 subtilisin kexin sedolisin [Haladaptatus sp. W1]